VDLMWQSVLMRMRWRSMAGSGGASTSLAGGGGWVRGRGRTAATRSLWHKERRERRERGRREREKEDEGNVVNPAPAHSIYRGVHLIYSLRLLAPYNMPQRLYPEKSARRSRQIFRQQTKRYNLNLNLGRRPHKKITSGRPDGKHDSQAPTSYKIRSLANHFAKTTKYMTEESEHYMDHLQLQAIYNLTGSRIQGGVSAYSLIGSRTRGYKPPVTLLDSKSEGTQVACDLIGSRTRHTR
jgi:hypothetical protein